MPLPEAMRKRDTDPLGTLSLILGMASLLIGVSGPVAVVLGFIARGRAKADQSCSPNTAFANAGIVTGVSGTIILAVVLLLFFGASAGPSVQVR
ncbi:MAG: DUF4190 domain-containing protein [Polyangiaceae bacterium]|nr:DUF4190 domain-containing protein [Polyangiaceae bacterium]